MMWREFPNANAMSFHVLRPVGLDKAETWLIMGQILLGTLEGHNMARWPLSRWTTVFTYGTIFVLFPLLSFLAYAWVQGWF